MASAIFHLQTMPGRKQSRVLAETDEIRAGLIRESVTHVWVCCLVDVLSAYGSFHPVSQSSYSYHHWK